MTAFKRRVRPEERPPFGSEWNTGWRLRLAWGVVAVLCWVACSFMINVYIGLGGK